MYGQLETLILGLMNFLGIPPGITVRKYYKGPGGDHGSENTTAADALRNNEFIKTIIDITADDVCIGATPFYLYGADEKILSAKLLQSYKSLTDALNRIGKWAAIDLLGRGWSIYSLRTQEIEVASPSGVDGEKLFTKINKANLVPVIVDTVRFYMKTTGEVVVRIGKEEAKSHLIFLHYSKDTLRLLENRDGNLADDKLPEDYLYEVIPEPIQLKHVAEAATNLWRVERAMYTYRMQLSKIVRFAEVEIGQSYGGNADNQDAIDSAASAVNANSISFSNYTTDAAQAFDDNIPIVPLRKGNGAINLKTDIPDFSQIKEMPDLEYTLNRLFLALRFPKTYADFNEGLNATAVSLIRGDIRYSRMVDYARSAIEDTVNKWVFGPAFDPLVAPTQIKMTALPNSEDDDVVDALSKYVDFNKEAFDFIAEAENIDEAYLRLDSVRVALGDVANLLAIQKWNDLMRDWIEKRFAEAEESAREEGGDLTAAEELGEDMAPAGAGNAPASAPEELGGAAEAFDLPPMNE